MFFISPIALVSRLTANAKALKGRPGVVAARALAERVTDAARQHARQLAGNPRTPRGKEQIMGGHDQ